MNSVISKYAWLIIPIFCNISSVAQNDTAALRVFVRSLEDKNVIQLDDFDTVFVSAVDTLSDTNYFLYTNIGFESVNGVKAFEPTWELSKLEFYPDQKQIVFRYFLAGTIAVGIMDVVIQLGKYTVLQNRFSRSSSPLKNIK